MLVFRERCDYWLQRALDEGETFEEATLLATERALWELLNDKLLMLHTRNRLFPQVVA